METWQLFLLWKLCEKSIFPFWIGIVFVDAVCCHSINSCNLKVQIPENITEINSTSTHRHATDVKQSYLYFSFTSLAGKFIFIWFTCGVCVCVLNMGEGWGAGGCGFPRPCCRWQRVTSCWWSGSHSSNSTPAVALFYLWLFYNISLQPTRRSALPLLSTELDGCQKGGALSLVCFINHSPESNVLNPPRDKIQGQFRVLYRVRGAKKTKPIPTGMVIRRSRRIVMDVGRWGRRQRDEGFIGVNPPSNEMSHSRVDLRFDQWPQFVPKGGT